MKSQTDYREPNKQAVNNSLFNKKKTKVTFEKNSNFKKIIYRTSFFNGLFNAAYNPTVKVFKLEAKSDILNSKSFEQYIKENNSTLEKELSNIKTTSTLTLLRINQQG